MSVAITDAPGFTVPSAFTHRWGQMLFDNVRHVTVNELTSMRGNGKKADDEV